MHQIAMSKSSDPRWKALETVQAARQGLDLRDRDIAVLRGLLTLIPAEAWEGPLMVHASNAVLQERCGGMEERTLRRRLAHLCAQGLILRRQSPNRKRFTLRDGEGRILVAYGFDLTPLREALPRLQDMAEALAFEAREIKTLRSLLRDRIYHADQAGLPVLHPALLRRKCSAADLRQAIAEMDNIVNATPVLSDSDSQIVRHIQTSNKDSEIKTPDCDLALETCLEALPDARAFAENRPETWNEVSDLAEALAPAIGVAPDLLGQARALLGAKGASLAILALVQAYGRIKAPARYLHALLQRAKTRPPALGRMFRAILAPKFPAGNQGYAAHS
jgi:replication initiation protein RepC